MAGGVAGSGATSVLHWGAHLAFWGFYLAFRTAAAEAMNMPTPEYADFPFFANRVLVVGGYAVATAVLLFIFIQRRFPLSSNARYAILFVGSIVLMPAMHEIETAAPMLFGAQWREEKSQFLTYAFTFGWALLLWAAMQAIIDYHHRVIEQARAINRAQSLAYDAQLRMLHYQFNPHFLFNTLNAISSLVLDRHTDQAERILLQLSGFLRYSLDRRPNELATLSEELEAQRKYLEIEQTRFGDKLKVAFDIAPEAERARLPSLILQPLLENAIKHAITPSARGGLIEVRAWRDGDLLRVCVADDGPGVAPVKAGQRRGLGLANARERLGLIFEERAGLVAQNRPEGGYAAEIWLPYEQEEASERIVARAPR